MLSISVALYGSGGVDPNQHSLKQMARVCSWKPTRKERDMTNIKMTTAMVFGAGLLLGAQSAQAHCDLVDGPVAKGSRMPFKPETSIQCWPMHRYPQRRKSAWTSRSRTRCACSAPMPAIADQAFMETVCGACRRNGRPDETRRRARQDGRTCISRTTASCRRHLSSRGPRPKCPIHGNGSASSWDS